MWSWWTTGGASSDAALPIRYDFPFWLYDEARWPYVVKMLTTQSFDRSRRRMALALGFISPIDPAGFDDYEIGATWSFHPAREPDTPPPAAPFTPSPPNTSFPALDRLEAELTAGFADVPVVPVMPFAHVSALPRPNTQAAVELDSCKAAMAQMMQRRPRGAFVDLYRDGPEVRDPENFMDATHYRKKLAMVIEGRIAEALAALARKPAAP